MSLLTIVNAIAQTVIGQSVPSASSSTDQNVQQIIGAVNEAGQEIAARYPWQVLVQEANFTTVAAESQGNILTICQTTSAIFGYILNETIWDRTQRRPVFGPKSPAEWQQLQAQFVNGPWWQYRLRGNVMHFTPTPPAGDVCYFEWVSRAWASSSLAITSGTQTSMLADTDVSILEERLVRLDARWRFKKSKELDYSEDFDIAEAAIIDAMSRDGAKPILNLNGAQGNLQPGIFIPAGNWAGRT